MLVFLPTLLSLILCNDGGRAQFIENWNLPNSPHFVMYATHGSSQSGFIDNEANDGASLRLTLNANPPPGVGGAPAAETLLRYLNGVYWTRAKTANCSSQAKAGVVSGIFTYFNDGGDRNGNGVVDNSELDFEFLCAKPEVVHLSIWTDYEETDPPNIRTAYRAINLRTGTVLQNCYRERFGECQPLSTAERQPTSLTPIPNFDSSTQYYWYGIELREDRIHFMMRVGNDNQIISLWDYRGPSERIPKDSMHFMHNVWHTNNWWPEDDNGTMIERPTSVVYMYVDTSSYTYEL